MGVSSHPVPYTDTKALQAAINGGLIDIADAIAGVPTYRIYPADGSLVNSIGNSADVAWTTVDCSAAVSSKAKCIYVMVRLGASVINAASYVIVEFREYGATPSYMPLASLQQKAGYVAGAWTDVFLILAIDDAGKRFQWRATKSGTITFDVNLVKLGYME